MSFLKKEKLIVIVLVLLPLITIGVWFSEGKQIASSEESFSLFNARDIIELNGVWEEIGTGFVNPTYLGRIPISFYAQTLQKAGLPFWFSQASVFYFLLVTATLSVFYFTKFLLSGSKQFLLPAFLSALFYSFNLYTQSQVWSRFLYSGIFAWSYLPLFLFLWTRWIKEGLKYYLVYFILFSFIFSAVFVQPVYLITLWVPAFLFAFISFFKFKINFKTFLSRASIITVVWVIINSWWIYPYTQFLHTAFFSKVTSVQLNFESLLGVSKHFPISQIILLRQKFFFNSEANPLLPWGDWYEKDFVLILSWLVLGFAILGWWKFRKHPSWLFLTFCALVGLFISKGANPPGGFDFFNWLFSNIPFTAALRNSYEKFGIVWLLPYSIFFGLGLAWLYERVKLKVKTIVLVLVIFLICGLLVWPIWTGEVFGGKAFESKIEAPKYYEEANNFLKSNLADGRILMLPIIPTDGVKYTWGYRGTEPSEFLFDNPSISKRLPTRYFENKYDDLYNAFVNKKNYNKFLDEMNIKYLVLHHDIEWRLSGASSSAQTKKILENNSSITFVNRFGELELYEYTENRDASLFVAEGEIHPLLNYTKSDPTHYVVNIENAKKPYKLIFKQTYNQFWEAKIDGQRIEDHLLVYEYANGWQIDKNGDYTIEVVFKVWPWE